jgi:hypothetical protein
MMRDVIEAKTSAPGHSLHRLGIAAHVFVDTFAHRGFIGERTGFNGVGRIETAAGQGLQRMPVPPIGHGQVGTYPDRPFLHWRYEDSSGRMVERDNPADFMAAADRLCEEFRRYRLGDPDAPVTGLDAVARDRLSTLVTGATDDDGDARLRSWLAALAADHFGFGPSQPTYVGKGKGSWKHAALGEFYLGWLQAAQRGMETIPLEKRSLLQRVGAKLLEAGVEHTEALADHFNIESVTYPFDPAFLSSHYKRFHDAAEEQRVAVFKKILPRFGIYEA